MKLRKCLASITKNLNNFIAKAHRYKSIKYDCHLDSSQGNPQRDFLTSEKPELVNWIKSSSQPLHSLLFRKFDKILPAQVI